MSRALPNSALLRLSKGAAMFIGPLGDTEPHRHHAIQIVVTLDDYFEIQIETIRLKAKMIILNSDVEHQFFSHGKINLMLYVEPESDFGIAIQNKIGNPYQIFEDAAEVLSLIDRLTGLSELSITQVRHCLLLYLQIDEVVAASSERIKKVLDFIEATPNKKISVPKLAQSIELSESRLQHIFKEQIGISMKRFMLWKRMLDGINFVTRGSDLSTAAYDAGFSDAAHMSRTFKEMFGINLSKIFENSRSLQVVIERVE